MSEAYYHKNSVFFVGGTGSKAGSSYVGGCTQEWFDNNFTELSDIMGADGSPLLSLTGCSYTNANKRIVKANGGEFSSVEVGMVSWLSDVEHSGSYSGQYEITDVDISGNWIEVNNWVAPFDSNNVSVDVGGAVDSLDRCLGHISAVSYNVEIYTNKDEVLSSTMTINSSGGVLSKNSHCRVIGFNTYPGDMDEGGLSYQSPIDSYNDGIASGSFVSIDGNGGSFSILTMDGQDNIEFRNLYLHNTGRANNENAIALLNTPRGVVFNNCRFDVLDRVINTLGEGVSLIGCYNGANISNQPLLMGDGSLLADCVLQGSETATHAVVNLTYDCGGVMLNNVIIGGYYGVRAKGLNSIIGNTFYGQGGACVHVHRDNASVTVCDNLLIPLSGGHGIGAALGTGGSVNHNNYNCFMDTTGALLSEPIGTDFPGALISNLGANSIETDPSFVDGGNGNFRPCNSSIFRSGRKDAYGIGRTMGAVLRTSRYGGRSRVSRPGRISVLR